MIACYHCGLDVRDPERWQLLEMCENSMDEAGQRRSFCCPACVAVYQCIRDSGFDAYYTQRTKYADTPESEAQTAEYQKLDTLLDDLAFVTTSEKSASCSAQLLIAGAHCSACAWLIESAIMQLPGVDDVQFNLQQNRANVSWNSDTQKLSTIMRTLHKLGYYPSGWSGQARAELHAQEKSQLQRRLGIAGLLMMQVGMMSLGLYAGEWQGMELATQRLLRGASLLLTTACIFYCATPFFRGAWNSLRKAQLTMDIPIAVALGTAYLVSLGGTLLGAELVYFDTVCMFVFFLLLSRFLEVCSRQPGTIAQQQGLPLLALKRVKSSSNEFTTESILCSQLGIGDIVLCRSGQAVCADGLIVEGESHFDESAFTGEHAPVHKHQGDSVLAGSVNMGPQLWVEVSKPVADSCIAHIEKLVDDAESYKPAYARLIDRISPWFVAGVLLLAVGTVFFWLEQDPSLALRSGLAVLVISCPCALALATPLALAEAHKSARRFGVVPASRRFLQVLPRVTDIVFDKTGTLSTGDLEIQLITERAWNPERIWQLAASLELISMHPLAAAFERKNTSNHLRVSKHCEVQGLGVEGCIDDRTYRLGKPAWSTEVCHKSDQCDSELKAHLLKYDAALCDESGVLAFFLITESLRADSKASLEELRSRGYRLHVLSGDTERSVTKLVQELPIEFKVADAKPEQKFDYIQALQQSGKKVLMIGDGVNDAPVLASADVSIAMHRAADVSKSSADAILLRDELNSIPPALGLAAAAHRSVVQNICWAIGYNSLSLPLAALGYLPPWAAAIGMSASSLIVILNSRRLASSAPDKLSGSTKRPNKDSEDSKTLEIALPDNTAFTGS